MEKTRILVVEDDQFLREFYQDLLAKEGYYVDTAVDGADAYQKIKQGGWNLVLLDIILPKMSGLEIVKKLKTERAVNLFNKLIFLTNFDNEGELKETKNLCDGYLSKSKMNPGDLVEQVKLILKDGKTPSR